MRLMRYGLVVLMLAFSLQAAALDLDTAKSRGLVGEQLNGYLGIVVKTPEVVELVSKINRKRHQAYVRIAKENGVSVEVVEQLAGRKAIKKTEQGNYVRTPSGEWIRK